MSKIRVGVYLRVSTAEQTTENQRRDLMVVADREGWKAIRIFEDAGISGAKGRDKRPAFDALCNAVARREIDLVAAWSVDRLGRSLTHLVGFLEELKSRKCDLYLHQQQLDTRTPMGRAMFQMHGIFAEFERAMIQERTKAGVARARAQGKQIGRPTVVAAISGEIARLAATGINASAISKLVGVDRKTAAKYAAP